MPGTVLSMMLFHSSSRLTTTEELGTICYSHFTDEETEEKKRVTLSEGTKLAVG